MAAATSIDGLVDEFVSTTRSNGVEVERHAVEEEMRERLADIAERLGVSVDAVLRDYVRRDWGREMALAVVAQIQEDCLLDPAASH